MRNARLYGYFFYPFQITLVRLVVRIAMITYIMYYQPLQFGLAVGIQCIALNQTLQFNRALQCTIEFVFSQILESSQEKVKSCLRFSQYPRN